MKSAKDVVLKRGRMGSSASNVDCLLGFILTSTISTLRTDMLPEICDSIDCMDSLCIKKTLSNKDLLAVVHRHLERVAGGSGV